ncbi:hypothetical protein LCGC14_2772250, partial [marine sediment metagenome]
TVQFEVFTDKEHATFLENYEKDQIEKSFDHNTRFADGEKPPIRKAFDKALFDVHSQYDDDLFKITGERKNSEEKTYDAIKRVVGVLKDKSDKLPGYIKEIADLKQGKVKDPDEQLKKDYQDLQTRHEKYKTDKDKEVSDMQTGHKKTSIKGKLVQSAARLKFKDAVPESARNSLIDATISGLLEMADLDGLVFAKDVTVTKGFKTSKNATDKSAGTFRANTIALNLGGNSVRALAEAALTKKVIDLQRLMRTTDKQGRYLNWDAARYREGARIEMKLDVVARVRAVTLSEMSTDEIADGMTDEQLAEFAERFANVPNADTETV